MSRRLDRLKQLGCVFVEPLDDIDELEKRYTVNGNPIVVDTPLGSTGLSFDGVSDGIEADSIFLSEDWTLSIWCKPYDYSLDSNYHHVLSRGSALSELNTNFAMGFRYREASTNWRVFVMYEDGAGVESLEIILDNGDPKNEWHLLCATFDYSTPRLELFFDGENLGGSNKAVTPTDGDQPITIGQPNTIAGQHVRFNGILKNAVVLNRVLEDQEIEDIYKGKLI